MKIFQTIYFILFSMLTNISAMEIEHVTKGPREGTPLIVKSFSPTLPTSAIAKSHSFANHLAQLPKELRVIIWQNTFEVDQKRAERLAELPTEGLVKYFYNAQQHCPLTIGNKTFIALDLLTLTRTKKEDLIKISLIKGCYKNHIPILNALPNHIKQDMVVPTTQPLWNGVGPEKQIGEYCLTGVCLSGCASMIAPCLIGGCHPSPWWWFPGGIALTYNVGMPLAYCITRKCCCCNKNVDYKLS